MVFFSGFGAVGFAATGGGFRGWDELKLPEADEHRDSMVISVRLRVCNSHGFCSFHRRIEASSCRSRLLDPFGVRCKSFVSLLEALQSPKRDLSYKNNKKLRPEQQLLTCSPEIRADQLTDDTEFLVIACDGVWDVLANQAVVDFVRLHLNNGVELSVICESLLQEAITRDPPSTDNMSVILVRFLHPEGNRGARAATSSTSTGTVPSRHSKSISL
ncbi:hypothetical protein OsI_16521 [Oryza sativa Indica Group]|uniref:protein-serine/threonine phosphatase n=1 Tax=Oryza sativa subsp. indica TaxID=39946 RepID=A2XV83_ORYSI|nr:hypothetical protein OsI_16521 [Oryza sativa Indica Group]